MWFVIGLCLAIGLEIIHRTLNKAYERRHTVIVKESKKIWKELL